MAWPITSPVPELDSIVSRAVEDIVAASYAPAARALSDAFPAPSLNRRLTGPVIPIAKRHPVPSGSPLEITNMTESLYQSINEKPGQTEGPPALLKPIMRKATSRLDMDFAIDGYGDGRAAILMVES